MVTEEGACGGEEKGYIGERHDEEAGLLYLHARWYDPALGRFLQPDWWDRLDASVVLGGGAQGLRTSAVGTNRYAYAGNDPINRSDPGGTSRRKIRPLQMTIPGSRRPRTAERRRAVSYQGCSEEEVKQNSRSRPVLTVAGGAQNWALFHQPRRFPVTSSETTGRLRQHVIGWEWKPRKPTIAVADMK